MQTEGPVSAMENLETKAGFPDVDGYVMHSHIECHASDSVTLSFHTHTPDLIDLINVQVFLLGASMKAANVELDPHLPFMTSYSITEEIIQGRRRNLLTIAFEKGEMSFLFEDAFHVRSRRPLNVPAELKERLLRR